MNASMTIYPTTPFLKGALSIVVFTVGNIQASFAIIAGTNNDEEYNRRIEQLLRTNAAGFLFFSVAFVGLVTFFTHFDTSGVILSELALAFAILFYLYAYISSFDRPRRDTFDKEKIIRYRLYATNVSPDL